ncbi:prolyl aminopeptidase [Shewanella sp. D64]|uniref:prolyl aminopeptidase n=1 Tax=unclassified Shewanella TaxID=196818 RepID=UPI0022BA4E5B|nr:MULTISPECIES: prolyl aminopeptidase [unclassified Shewanella]MEC4724139.1 prolyl aminopeptidase [Shewanella sp. D64]MEC4736159.1 prolyl aminopeptidase [Shewanella sp. E94]WBJ97901.1 prolyl aminopeptidase [Shewanella sp. MTB7]
MNTLYPDIEPYTHYYLSMSAKKGTVVHQLYVEECGNPQGLPVIFLHGGPGSGCRASHRCFFNPKLYRIILFDQRGCGRSRPYWDLESNTTAYLVDDIEQIRVTLAIDSWVVFGGSWGSTLGLVYAQHYPERVMMMILRGIFLARQHDIDWVYSSSGAARIFPEAWELLMSVLTPLEQRTPLKSLYHHLVGDNEFRRAQVQQAFNQWEQQIVTLRELNYQISELVDVEPCNDAAAMLQLHYCLNLCFIAHQPILANIDSIREIPTHIVHGRYDMVCPVEQAWELAEVWPEASLTILPLAGHAAGELTMVDTLVGLTDKVAAELCSH